MSIRTKLRLNAVVTVALTLVVALTVVVSYKNMKEASRTDTFASRVIRDVSDLSSLTYAYLMIKDKRPRVQWELKYASLGKVLSEHVAGNREQEVLLTRLRSNHAQMKRLFDVVSENPEKTSAAKAGGSTPYDELNEGITAQLMARAEMMANDAMLFNRESERHMETVRLTALILILVSASLLIASASITGFLLARSIGGSIRALVQGTQRIAAGDLDHRVDIRSKDEISHLAAAFNAMAAELKLSYGKLEHEVAEQKRAQEAVRQQAELIELSPDAILVRDMDSRIIFWNAGAEETYGWTKAEAEGKVTHSFLKAQFPVPFDEHMASLMAEGRWEGELVHSRKDGARITVLSRHALRHDETGRPEAILEINVDITERKRAEEETRRYASRLEMSNRELQDFAFVASHDLQEPLRKIQAFGDQLKRDHAAALDAEAIDYLDRMQGAAERMQALIQSLLNYSRVTTKPQPFSRTDLGIVAREAASDLEAALHETGGKVEIAELAAIEADPLQVRQLFQNLIGNGLKFRRDETPVVKVYGDMVEDSLGKKDGARDGTYQIFVEDNGIGFDEKYLDRIFIPFQRLHGRGTYDGTGIGLAICRKIVERHGGTITATSSIGKGSTFIVTLPVKQPREEWNDQSPV